MVLHWDLSLTFWSQSFGKLSTHQRCGLSLLRWNVVGGSHCSNLLVWIDCLAMSPATATSIVKYFNEVYYFCFDLNTPFRTLSPNDIPKIFLSMGRSYSKPICALLV